MTESSTINLDDKATQAGFGRLVGVSQQAISDKVHQGVLTEGGTIGEWLREYSERLRMEAAGRGGDDQEKLTSARTRRELADAHLKEMQYQKEIRNLVPVEVIEPLLESWATVARSDVQTAILKITDAIESKYKIKIDSDLIDGPMESAYRHIASYPKNLYSDDFEGGGEVDST